MQESLRPGNERDALMMKANTVKQVKELISPIQADTLKPNTKADLVFSASADMTTACQNYGKVLPLHLLLADPSKCHATGKGLEVAAMEKKSTVLQEGKFLRMFGRRGHGRGKLDWPSAIDVDTNNLVYVSEYYNHRVSVFTPEGLFVVSFGAKGQIYCSCGLAVDDSGIVYVCDIIIVL